MLAALMSCGPLQDRDNKGEIKKEQERDLHTNELFIALFNHRQSFFLYICHILFYIIILDFVQPDQSWSLSNDYMLQCSFNHVERYKAVVVCAANALWTVGACSPWDNELSS